MNKKRLLCVWRFGLLLGILLTGLYIDPEGTAYMLVLYYIITVLAFSIFGMFFFAAFFGLLINGIKFLATFDNESLDEVKEVLVMLLFVIFSPFIVLYCFVMGDASKIKL